MIFKSYQLFYLTTGCIILFQLINVIRYNQKAWSITLLASSVAVLLQFVKEHTIIVLAILCSLTYLSGLVIKRKQYCSLLGASITFLLLVFSLRNYPIFDSLFSIALFEGLKKPIFSVQNVGLSYILFKLVHWLVDCYKGKIGNSSWLVFVNYVFFFPTFLAGPIDTYQNFSYWIKTYRPRYNKSLFFAGISRIFLGSVKTFLIVPEVIVAATDYTFFEGQLNSLLSLLLSLLCYSIYIYVDFSGYSDIAIGTSYLLGIKTPENFNNPYFSENLSTFWKKWHITFSRFLRIYVFKPSLNLFNRVLPNAPRLLISILGYLFTFFVCGIWHGSTLNFVFWGLWHGIGLSIAKFWSLSTSDSAFTQNKYYKAGSTLLTFLFVTIGWMFFHYKMNEIAEIINYVSR